MDQIQELNLLPYLLGSTRPSVIKQEIPFLEMCNERMCGRDDGGDHKEEKLSIQDDFNK